MACRKLHKKCTPPCVLSLYFNEGMEEELNNLRKIFRINMVIDSVAKLEVGDDQKLDSLISWVQEANHRVLDPSLGILRMVRALQEDLARSQEDLARSQEELHTAEKELENEKQSTSQLRKILRERTLKDQEFRRELKNEKAKSEQLRKMLQGLEQKPNHGLEEQEKTDTSRKRLIREPKGTP